MDAEREYRWLTDESNAASGDYIVYADEGEYMDQYADPYEHGLADRPEERRRA